MKKTTRIWNLCLIISLLSGIALTRGVSPVLAQASSTIVSDQLNDAVDVLLLWDATSQTELDQAAEAVTAAGGAVVATFPNQGMFARLSREQMSIVSALPGLRWMSTAGSLDGVSLMDADLSGLAGEDLGASVALQSWATYIQEDQATDYIAHPESPVDDALPAPDTSSASLQSVVPSETTSAGATKYQTSEYMLGSIQVDVFLPESNGAIDNNLENWTSAQIDKVVGEVTRGITWWTGASTQGGRPSAGVSFNIVFHTPQNEPDVVATSYEPILYPYTQQGLWMEEILSHLGYTGDYFDSVRRYTQDRRIASGRDWGFTLWIANSEADLDGRFADGRFAYAYIYGPIAVMTYDNNGWGSNNMEIVLAHEIGHVFGALDEYASSGCTDTQTTGYLNVANSNCENGTPATETSIMRSATNQQLAYPEHLVSTPVRGMVGWRDSDLDRIYDPADTTAVINLQETSLQVISSEPTWSGTVEDIPYPSPTRTPISLNRIVLVDARIDLGDWWDCAASDGLLDEPVELFTCAGSALSEGSHSLTVHSQNTAGVDVFTSLDILVQTGAPYFVGVPAFTTQLSFPVSWNSDITLTTLSGYDIQVRLNEDLEWTDWLVNSPDTTAIFGPICPDSGEPLDIGDEVHFRIRTRFMDGSLSGYRETSTHIGWGVYLPVMVRP